MNRKQIVMALTGLILVGVVTGYSQTPNPSVFIVLAVSFSTFLVGYFVGDEF